LFLKEDGCFSLVSLSNQRILVGIGSDNEGLLKKSKLAQGILKDML
jgi:hypothetical protein